MKVNCFSRGEGVTGTAMEKAGGETCRSPEQSFLATLCDSQVTLLSVYQRWSFRKSPEARASSRPAPSLEEGSPPSPEGEFSQKVLNGTREISSNQVSVIAEGLKSQERVGSGLQMEVSTMSYIGGILGGE